MFMGKARDAPNIIMGGEGRAGPASPVTVEPAPVEVLDHAHRGHSLLGASRAKMWLNCPPSARLNDQVPGKPSSYAEEGTAAHELGEYKIRHGYLHDPMQKPQSEYYTEEIDQATEIYADFVITTIEDMKRSGIPPLVLVEEKLDFSHIAPEGYGTGDIVLVGKTADGRGLIHVVDYKNGKGVFVDADHNPQMMLYALGALAAYGYILPIELIRMTIVQPRLDNISTCEMPVEELTAWGESIKPIAKLAYEGKGEQKCGEWCRFCNAKPMCQACKDEALALARDEFLDLDADTAPLTEETDATAPYGTDSTAPTFKQPGLVSLSDLAAVLPILNRIASWIEAVFAFLSSEAINHGVTIPGYKVVEGRSKRVFTDTKAVINAATAEGYTDIYRRELISLADFEKMMGKKRFAEILGDYVAKPPGKLALVPESDPRPAVDLATAADEFEALE